MALDDECMKTAKIAIDTIIKKYKPEELPPAGTLHYHQGVFLQGVYDFYKEYGDDKYYSYIKDYLDTSISENGIVSVFDSFSFDDIQALILLFPIIEKDGVKERYERALITGISVIKNWKRDKGGGLWHKLNLPNQMWLDGIYMISRLRIMYAKLYGCPEIINDVYKQAFLMYERMKKDNGLLYHAWSDDEVNWRNCKTGCSPEVWARALGWYTFAACEIIELDEIGGKNREKLKEILGEILKSLIK